MTGQVVSLTSMSAEQQAMGLLYPSNAGFAWTGVPYTDWHVAADADGLVSRAEIVGPVSRMPWMLQAFQLAQYWGNC